MKRVYINTTNCFNWILKILADDIQRELISIGIECNSGPYEEYGGEEIAYHMWWRSAVPYSDAETNSVFITHTDDVLKERDLIKMKDQFDSYIAMSKEDAQFLIDIGYDYKRVFGVELPVRNSYVRPLSIGIFSRCYPDNRKNENWLLEYCRGCRDLSLINFVFIGDGWGHFVEHLYELGGSFEWHCASRSMPYEYFFQQLKLSNLDYYLYLGMDGGAMGTYDAYAMGVSLFVTDDGFHKAIPDIECAIESKESFFAQLDKIVELQRRKMVFFKENSPSNYVKELWSIWVNGESEKDKNYHDITYPTGVVANKRRSYYFKVSLKRMKEHISSLLRVVLLPKLRPR